MDHTAIDKLAHQIVEHLDGFTVAEVQPRGALLVGAGGKKLAMQLVWNHPDRLRISGVYPPGEESYGLDWHHITVAIARGPQVIAREIMRRLLPGYDKDLVVVDERIAQRVRGDQRRARTVKHLLGILPGATITEHPRQAVVRWYGNDASCTFTLGGDGTNATIEMRTGADLTTRVAQTVAAHARQAPVR